MLSYAKDYTFLFQYKELDRISGQPTLDSLTNILRQVKINAQSVPPVLGGGNYSYLVLVLTPEIYNSLPNVIPFIRPVHPGIFTILQPASQTETTTTRITRTSADTTATTTSSHILTNSTIANEKAIHEEQLRLYHECEAVERLIRQQIIDCIHPDYLEALRNRTTCMISDLIPEIITFIQQSYGKITDTEFYEREDELKNLSYDPELPVDTVFNKIDKFQAMCELTGNKKK